MLQKRSLSPLEDTAAKRRKLVYTDQDIKLAAIYEGLAHELRDTRLDAAKQLLLELSPIHEISSECLERVLNRLVRGLCSSRKAAQFGFFVALTELLRQIYNTDREKNLSCHLKKSLN